MIERFMHHLRVELPAADETATAARLRLADKFPRTALRRMTHLGLLIGSTLDGVPLGPEDALVYASTFAETRALEEFLASFPAASPLLFQTSMPYPNVPAFFADSILPNDEALRRAVRSGMTVASGFATSEPSTFYDSLWNHIVRERAERFANLVNS